MHLLRHGKPSYRPVVRYVSPIGLRLVARRNSQNDSVSSGIDEAGVFGRRLVAVVGKGGVGKTTIAAALAQRCARAGQSVLLVDIEGKHDLARLFGSDRLSAKPQVFVPADPATGRASLMGCSVAPDTALLEYLHGHGLGVLAKRLGSSGAVDVIATSAPGIKDLLVLGRIKSYVNENAYDVIIIDTPASGHAVTFLLGPQALADTVATGTIRRQADEVRALLADERSGVLLVTLAEETPVNETIETAYALEDRVGVSLIAVVVNALVPSVPQTNAADLALLPNDERTALEEVLGFERSRVLRQNEQIRDLGQRLPLPQMQIFRSPTQRLGQSEVGEIAEALSKQLTALARAEARK
jgi:anion-transporting  ArsA/GET3 family ATPase